MKICSLGAELFHAGGQADMKLTIVAFRPFRTRVEIAKEVKCTGEDFSVFNTTM